MNVVDSSGWIEYFIDGPNAEAFSPTIENTPELIVPVLCLYEVFKRIYQMVSEDDALKAVVLMQQGQVVPLDSILALSAARLSSDLKLPMADSIILATARAFEANLWTQDADFEGIEGVNYISKS